MIISPCPNDVLIVLVSKRDIEKQDREREAEGDLPSKQGCPHLQKILHDLGAKFKL